MAPEAIGAPPCGNGVAPVNAAPYQLAVQMPLCADVPNGSVDVAEIAIPVSKPSWLVTNGNSRFVTQGTIENRFLAVEVSAKRGMVVWIADVCVLVGA